MVVRGRKRRKDENDGTRDRERERLLYVRVQSSCPVEVSVTSIFPRRALLSSRAPHDSTLFVLCRRQTVVAFMVFIFPPCNNKYQRACSMVAHAIFKGCEFGLGPLHAPDIRTAVTVTSR